MSTLLLWDGETDSQVVDQTDFLLPHERLNHEWSKSVDTSEWTDVPVDSPFNETRKVVCTRLGISDPDNTFACGVWGDSATYFTRGSIFLMLIHCLTGIVHTQFWVCAFGKQLL